MKLDQIFKFQSHRSQRYPKVRGLKNKAKRILKEAECYEVDIQPDSSFDYDHIHLDWDGIGDLGAQIRLQTIKAHLRVFKKYVDALSVIDKPYQLFMTCFIDDSGQDAVYIHSENPDSSFPIVFDDAEWNIPVFESFLNSICPELNFISGRNDDCIIVFAENIGEPLKLNKPNQILDPTWTTPVLKAESDSQAGQD
jgi:hypothetical protein